MLKKIKILSLRPPAFWCFVVALVFLYSTGCMMMTGRVMRYGYDELQVTGAFTTFTEAYPYIDFTQVFPDTYRFDLSKEAMHDLILNQIRARGEEVLENDRHNGIVFTAAKEIPLYQNGQLVTLDEPIQYQLSIYLTPKTATVTYVTTYPTVLKGDYYEVYLPLATNMLKGIFFGSLAGEMYPDQRRASARITGADIQQLQPAVVDRTELTHIVEPGDTLGGIAKKYTGKAQNYQKIAEHNQIIDPKNLRVGQEIRIPGELAQ